MVYTSALGGQNRRAVDEGRSARVSSEGPQTEAGRREKSPETNVVRLPRDWLGPREELVPFGPRAQGLCGATEAEDPELARPLGSDAFWSEQSGELQDALQAPDADVARAGVSRGLASEDPAPSRRLGERASDAVWPVASMGSPRWSARGGRKRASVALLAFVAGVAAVAFVILGSTSQRTTPRTTITSASSSIGAGTAADRARERTRLVRRLQTARRGVLSRSAGAHADRLRAIRHAAPKPTVHGAAVARTGVQAAASAPAVSYGNPTAGAAPPVQSPASAALPTTSTPPSASSAAPDQSSSPVGTHPYGLGGTVGPGHSPNG